MAGAHMAEDLHRGAACRADNTAVAGLTARRFRESAHDCRNLARTTVDEAWRHALLEMAEEFDAEAEQLDRDADLEDNLCPSTAESRH